MPLCGVGCSVEGALLAGDVPHGVGSWLNGAGLTRNPGVNHCLKSLLFVNHPVCGGGNPYVLLQSKKSNCIAEGGNGLGPLPSFLIAPRGFPRVWEYNRDPLGSGHI